MCIPGGSLYRQPPVAAQDNMQSYFDRPNDSP